MFLIIWRILVSFVLKSGKKQALTELFYPFRRVMNKTTLEFVTYCIGKLAQVLAELEKRITALARKYATSYNDLSEQLATAQAELSALVAELTGDEFALK